MKTKAEELVSEFVEKSKTTPGQHTVFELADLAYQSGILAGLEMAAQIFNQMKPDDLSPCGCARVIRAKAKEMREGK